MATSRTARTVVIDDAAKPLVAPPEDGRSGRMPNDGGDLILTEPTNASMLARRSRGAAATSKRFMGSTSSSRGKSGTASGSTTMRASDAARDPAHRGAARRVSQTIAAEEQGAGDAAMAATPYRFGRSATGRPSRSSCRRHSSERRSTSRWDTSDADTVISDSAIAVYDAEPWLFALLTSRMHMAWVRAVGGKLETRLPILQHDRLQQLPVPPLRTRSRKS